MSSSILHQCSFCGHVSDISLGLAAFIENPYCNQCGLSASESNGKLQDELATLFDRQMSMTSIHPESQPPISYSISQHYHHSSHVVSPPTPTDITDVLQHHGLDPATLSPAQLDLFRNADAEQKQRLIQTWQLYSRVSAAGPTDDLEMQDSMDHAEEQREQAEPYMVSGYETVAEKPLPQEPTTGQPYASSTDPVYKTGSRWESALVGPMESQYGAFQERNRCNASYDAQWLCPS
ncbi:hypothetical protein N7492_004874 [Penicillium capsulatum]|uniref:Uncharacterized protein n=1 Tax=Penicillium capsulatum TaxID=69766 RepID=A0A9W9I8R8_9EURO|nr:hypothetical protein N7492_004874 [Penicillium capsulatum]KAJ6136018.1 hypothetical protein N7512_001178 [Penicillium capsulatum]